MPSRNDQLAQVASFGEQLNVLELEFGGYLNEESKRRMSLRLQYMYSSTVIFDAPCLRGCSTAP